MEKYIIKYETDNFYIKKLNKINFSCICFSFINLHKYKYCLHDFNYVKIKLHICVPIVSCFSCNLILYKWRHFLIRNFNIIFCSLRPTRPQYEYKNSHYMPHAYHSYNFIVGLKPHNKYEVEEMFILTKCYTQTLLFQNIYGQELTFGLSCSKSRNNTLPNVV